MGSNRSLIYMSIKYTKEKKTSNVSLTLKKAHGNQVLSNQHYQHRTNQKLCLCANAVFQNRGVCGQAFPSFPSPSPVIPFFCSRPNFSRWTRAETLATQAKRSWQIVGSSNRNFGCWQLMRKRRLSSPLVRFSTDLYGKHQSDDDAKYNMCSVFNDTSHFWCSITMHKLNFEFTSREIGHSQLSLLRENREGGRNQA